MKRKILLYMIIATVLICTLAITAGAENKVIKHTTLPTLDAIRANPSAYVSHLDAFDASEYKAKDATSVVVLSDLAQTPTYYVFPSYYILASSAYSPNLTLINEAILDAGIDAFSGYAASGGRGSNVHIIRLEMPTYVTTLGAWNKFESTTNIKELYFPTKLVTDETGAEKIVTCVTSIGGQNTFTNCSSLEVIHNFEYLPTSVYNPGSFSGCANLELDIVIPTSVTSIPNGCFEGCKKIKSITFHDGVTSIAAGAFWDCDSITELYIPNGVTSLSKKSIGSMQKLEVLSFGAGLTDLYSTDHNLELIYDCPNLQYVYMPATFATTVQNTGNSILGGGSKVTIFFTGTKAQAEAIQTKLTESASNNLIKNATFVEYDKNINYMNYADNKNYAETLGYTILVYGYNKCDAFYDSEHDLEITDCTIGDDCSRCKLIIKESSHALVNTLTYPNGFDKKGVYNYHCTNSCCTMDGEEIIDQEVDEIITFLGYSVPETAGVKGINAGFKVDKDLLNDYNDINDVDATLTLFMVNCKNDEVNISKIFKDGTLDLETGVKGINVAITSTSYTNISVEVRGFDDSSVTGNYYTLKLITAIAVKTEEGTHFVQAGLKTGNDKQAVDGVDFNIVSAENVYDAVAE